MRARKELDIGWRGLAKAALSSLPSSEASGEADELVCLSVRTAFDLYLRVKRFEPGSEVVMSAITIPDMATIVRSHGLIPVPVDLDPETMQPSARAVESAMGPKTCAVVVAHLLGGLVDLCAIARVCLNRKVPLVEDCAQAFGAGYRGHFAADMSLFSFGSIKSATALGGGVALVPDPKLRCAMRLVEATYPEQGRSEYLRKVGRYAAIKLATRPSLYGTLLRTAEKCGLDADTLLTGLTRGFPGDDLLAAIRRRPSPALRRMVTRIWAQPSHLSIAARARAGRYVAKELSDFVVGGRRGLRPTYWLLAVAVENPEALRRALKEGGFDSAKGTTSLAVIEAPPGRASARAACEFMQRVVYLPISGEMSPVELFRLVSIVRRIGNPALSSATNADVVAADVGPVAMPV